MAAASALAIIVLVAGVGLAIGFGTYQMQQATSLASEVDKVEQSRSALQQQIQEKDSHLTELSQRVSGLESETESWRAQFEQTDVAISELQQNYDSLNTDYSLLQSENKDLRATQSTLQELATSEKERRESIEAELSISARPPYTIIQGRQVGWVFQDSKGNTYDWKMPIDTYRGVIGSPEPPDYLTLRKDDGSISRLRDHTKFVESDSFAKVIDRVYENAGTDYQFLYEIWYITSQLTTYSTDIGEEPRWSLETFTEGGGDCEDLTILIASMLKASSYTDDWEIRMVYMDADNPEQPQNVNHVALYVETDEFTTFIESTTKDDGLNHWKVNIKGWYFDL